ncbi:MAG: hypothetical protein II530_02925 [Bacteroidaceae bacterium]|nr:hypothetical protein [Bacteroidaceae bacterium]
MNDQILNFLTQANENPEMQDRIKMMAKGAAEGADVSNFAGEILGMAKKLGFNFDLGDIQDLLKKFSGLDLSDGFDLSDIIKLLGGGKFDMGSILGSLGKMLGGGK